MSTELYKLIESGHVSEKSMRLADKHNQIVFKVKPQATKQQIAAAVSSFFEVEVDSVRTVNVKGKTKSFKQVKGVRKKEKKAYVTLAEGHDIDFLGNAD